jgi:organic hydroperoxide reductase OsmC/OhrA
MSDLFQIALDREEHYRFRVDFESAGVAHLVVDESPPLGQGAGPNPSRLLAAAVGECLSSSLIFCLGKSRIEVATMRTIVRGTYVRNERNRLRVGRLDVEIALGVQGTEPGKLSKCLELFEDFCVVTASVRKGVPVGVVVADESGNRLYAALEAG